MSYKLDLLSFDSVLIASCMCCSPWQHSLQTALFLGFFFLHYRKKASLSARHKRPNYWVTARGSLTPACDCFWKNERGRNEDASTFGPHHGPRLQALILYKAWDFSWSTGHSSWGTNLLCSPLCRLRIEATFLFLPNSVSVFFMSLQWAQKATILVAMLGRT